MLVQKLSVRMDCGEGGYGMTCARHSMYLVVYKRSVKQVINFLCVSHEAIHSQNAYHILQNVGRIGLPSRSLKTAVILQSIQT